MFIFIGMMLFQPTILDESLVKGKSEDDDGMIEYNPAKTMVKLVICTFNSLLLSYVTLNKLFGIL